MSQTAIVAEPISGDRLYQDRARRVLPLLVRQAEAGETIYYSDLAKEIEIPNPRNLNYPLGSIGRTIERLSEVWREKIPSIQCLVINKRDNLPGEGIGWFLVKKEDFSSFPRSRQQETVKHELAKIFAYPRWREVLDALSLPYPKFDISSIVEKASHFTAGESDRHLRLKEYIAKNPDSVGLKRETPPGQTEVRVPSGDFLDVSFLTSDEWVAAEVKSKISPPEDIARGLFQCVKYRAVMEAVQVVEGRQRAARAVLALEGEFPSILIPAKNALGVEVFERISPK